MALLYHNQKIKLKKWVELALPVYDTKNLSSRRIEKKLKKINQKMCNRKMQSCFDRVGDFFPPKKTDIS